MPTEPNRDWNFCLDQYFWQQLLVGAHSVHLEASWRTNRAESGTWDALCWWNFHKSPSSELGRKTFPGNCPLRSFLVFFLCTMLESQGLWPCTWVSYALWCWLTAFRDHTHNGNNRCSMDFKQAWNRVLAVMALSGPTFYYTPQSWQRWLESTWG